jgi:hypothetical protein
MHAGLCLLTLTASLAGCIAGDSPPDAAAGYGDYYCYYMDGGGARVSVQIDPACLGCKVDSASLALDGQVASFARLHFPDGAAGAITLRATAANGLAFPAGSRAGVLAGFSRGNLLDAPVLRTFLHGALQEERAQPDPPVTARAPDDEEQFYGLTTTQPFDAVEFSFQQAAPLTGLELVVRLHEFCRDFDGPA